MNRGRIFDVIIIGAGSVGTPAALNLAKAGLSVLVLDRVASVGQGSNKKAIGGVRATHSDPAKIRICLRSIEIFSTWKEIYGDEIEWYQGGYCFVAYRPQEEQSLKKLLDQQKGFGLEIEWHSATDLLKRVPDINPENLLGGTFSPKDGSASPLLATHAIYSQAMKAGAIFHFNEHVTDIFTDGGKINRVRTDKGEYSTRILVNAAGPWASEIGELLHISIPVHPDSHEAAITEPVAHFFEPMIVDIRPFPGSSNFYFYQHLNGQVIFCLTPDPPIWGTDQRETSAFLPMIARRMVQVMPRLQNVRVRRTWRGLYPMTPDGSPILGWSEEVGGFLQAVGLCGQGFMLGPGMGEMISRLVTNQVSPADLEILPLLSPARQFAGLEILK